MALGIILFLFHFRCLSFALTPSLDHTAYQAPPMQLPQDITLHKRGILNYNCAT